MLITTKDYLLSLLDRQGYIAVSQAARDFQVSRQCVSQTLQSMEKRGLVVKDGKVYRRPNNSVFVPVSFKSPQEKADFAQEEILRVVKSQGWVKCDLLKIGVSKSVARKVLFNLSSGGILKHHFEGFYTFKGSPLPGNVPLKDRRDPSSQSAHLRLKFLELAQGGPVRYIELMRASGCSRELTASFLREFQDKGLIQKLDRGLYQLAPGVQAF